MKLDEVSLRDDALVYMERYVDEGAKRYSAFSGRNEVAPEYQPTRRGAPSFELVTVRAPLHRVWVVEEVCSASLRDHYLRSDGVTFVVHPDTWASSDVEYLDELRGFPRAEPIRAAPTASTRTVFVTEAPAGVPRHFLKLHVPRRISRFNRRLRRINIENSVRITRELAQVRFGRFAYLPDVLGCTFGHDSTSWGFLVREGTPRPFVPGRMLIPCFALYAGDLEHPDDLPLVVQLIRRLGADPEAFLVDEIMVPVVACWAKLARERGLLLESHAQNTLLEVDADLRPHRIVHRDFDIWIDPAARKRAGVEISFQGGTIGDGAEPSVEAHYSLVYDRFIGCEFFDCLLKSVARFLPVHEDAVRSRVSKAFHEVFPEVGRTFPGGTTFYFSNAPPEGKEFTLVDTNEPPKWR